MIKVIFLFSNIFCDNSVLKATHRRAVKIIGTNFWRTHFSSFCSRSQDVVDVLVEHGAKPPPADDNGDDDAGRASRTGPESGSWGAYFRDMLNKALTQSLRTLDMIANEIDPIADIPPGVGVEVSGVGGLGGSTAVAYSASDSSTTITTGGGAPGAAGGGKSGKKTTPRRAATEKVVLTKQPSTAVQSSGASSSKKTPRN